MAKDLIASIQYRLLALSRTQIQDNTYTLIRYFQERLIYRILVKSEYATNFALKGGAFMYAVQEKQSRLTKDIDLSGTKIQNDLDSIKAIFKKICAIKVAEDAVVFDIETITTETINEEGKYTGVRVVIDAYLGKQTQKIQIDIGFGDIITPTFQSLEYPTLLEDFPPFNVNAYNIETSIAEKFQAMIDLGLSNSRMKDFYDVYGYLIGNKYNMDILKTAIIQTFKNRQTKYTENHPIWDVKFYEDTKRLGQWKSFLKKNKLIENLDFKTVIDTIQSILKPIYESLK